MLKFLLACFLTCAGPLAAHAELPDPVRFSVVLELGDVKQAATWLDEGLDADFEGALIGTGLMIGAWEGNIPLMELFLARGADIDRRNRFGETALMLAAWKNRREAVRWLLDHGAKVDFGQDHAWTALHYATFAGHADVVEDLLAAGADVNARSTNGSTVVMMAAREGHGALAQRLLDAGANPALKNDYGDDAVSWAMRQGNYALARMLTDTASFSALARTATEAPAPPPPPRSQPAPDQVDELLRKARLAEMSGQRDEALRIYQQAWAELHNRQEPQKVGAGNTAQKGKRQSSQPPKALIIRARRSAPEQQSLSVVESSAEEMDVDRLLERAHAAEAAGNRQEALRLFRQAAAQLKPR